MLLAGFDMSDDDNHSSNSKNLASEELTTEVDPAGDTLLQEGVSEVDTPEENNEEIESSGGPLTIQPLIQWLPRELDYTAFDAYDKNLYLGTRQGDLLHYFEMEPGNYMLVSQTKFNDTNDFSVEKIEVLPKIEIALVHFSSALHFFLLPEFAPVPNMDSVKDVSDFNVVSYSKKSNTYKVRTFGTTGVKSLVISTRNVTITDSRYKHAVTKAATCGKKIMAATGSNYELVDLETGKGTPLFKISETSAILSPVIASYSPTEFLLACGSSEDENAMGLVLNSDGDITQGTIVFEKFPTDFVVEDPFVIVDYGDLGIYVYRVQVNSEPSVIQRVTSSKHKRIRIAQMSHIFTVNNSKNKQLVVDKMRLVPLCAGNHEFRINQEKDYIEKIFEEKTSTALYGTAGIYLLLKEPYVLQVSDYSESTIGKIEDLFQNSLKKDNLGAFSEMQKQFLRTLYLLLNTFHCSSIDKSIVDKWLAFSEQVDIRVFLYLCGIQTFGDLWVPHGLINFISETRSLKLNNKIENYLEILSHARQIIQSDKRNDIKDLENVLRSLDLSIVRKCVQEDCNVDIASCEPTSYPVILAELQTNASRYSSVIFEIHYSRHEYANCLGLLRNQNRKLEFSEFLDKNLDDIWVARNYSDKDRLADVLFMISADGKDEDQEQVFENAVHILERSNLNTKDLISMTEDSSVKIAILERLGPGDLNETCFMIDYYVSKLQGVMETDNLWDFFGELAASYSQDLDYMKPNLKRFLDLSVRHEPKCSNMLAICKKIETLIYEKPNISILKSVIDRIRKFDIADILSLYFVRDEDKEAIFGPDLLEKLMTLNDFETINRVVKNDEVVEVLKYYLQLDARESSLFLVGKHLEKHMRILSSLDQITEILEALPLDYSFASISNAVCRGLIKFDGIVRQQELQKALLKQQILAKQELAQKLGVE